MKERLRKLLFEIEQLKRIRVQDFLLGIGLTPGQGQARILMSLADAEYVTQRQLADECMLDVTTMSRTLDRLQKQGLIRRERDAVCRRAYRISLSEEGRKKAEQVSAGFGSLEEMLFDGMDENDMARLERLLDRIKENLKAE